MKWKKEMLKSFEEGFSKAIYWLFIVVMTLAIIVILPTAIPEIIEYFNEGIEEESIFLILLFLTIGVIGGILSVRKQRKSQIES